MSLVVIAAVNGKVKLMEMKMLTVGSISQFTPCPTLIIAGTVSTVVVITLKNKHFN